MSAPSSQQWVGSTVLGRYKVVRILATGGMGAVYLGRAEGARGFVRPVVIKRILSTYAEDDEAVAMFVREARILSQLQDPGIVSVLDFGQEDNDTLVMVLEYVHGYHLGYWQAYLQKTVGKMDVELASYVVTRVLDALSHAHNFTHPDGRHMTIVHRDISPSNVLLDIHGNVKLVDFGIARSQGEEVDEYKTQAPRLKGKFSYMPVELFRGEEPSVQTDVYACGVMLYELLAGSNPFRGRTMAETYDKVRTVKPVTLAALRDDITPELDATVQKAMAQNAAERFASASEMANALRAARSSSDEELRARLRRELAEAYAGPLPEKLEVEPLSARSVAWRDTEGAIDPSLEIATDPPLDGESATVVVPEPPGFSGVDRTLTSPPAGTDGATVNVPAPSALLSASRREPTQVRPIFWVAGTLAVVAALGAAFWLGGGRQEAPERVVVIERQAPAAAPTAPSVEETPPEPPEVASATSEPTVAPAPTAEPTSPDKAPPPSKTRPHSAEPSGPDPRNLTRAFSRQQGKVERCFTEFPEQLGTDAVSIKFQIDTKGAVQSAELSPAGVAASGLGTCLLKVARAATFPPQREAIAFRIPITARRVQ